MNILDRILDRTRRFPKFVDPPTHIAMDYLTSSYFMLLASAFWGRDRRAAATALINGWMVLGLTILTDYPGGLKKISFRTHGKGDMVQMLTAAGLPSVLGFGSRPTSLPLRLQALQEALIISITDFEGEQRSRASRQVA
jgi:hypothetical protein